MFLSNAVPYILIKTYETSIYSFMNSILIVIPYMIFSFSFNIINPFLTYILIYYFNFNWIGIIYSRTI